MSKQRPPRRNFVPQVERLEDRTLLNVGNLDPLFGTAGLKEVSLGQSAQASAIVVLHDTSDSTADPLLIAGTAGAPGHGDFFVTRLLPDGTPDQNFAAGGTRLIDFGADDQATVLAIQGNGV